MNNTVMTVMILYVIVSITVVAVSSMSIDHANRLKKAFTFDKLGNITGVAKDSMLLSDYDNVNSNRNFSVAVLFIAVPHLILLMCGLAYMFTARKSTDLMPYRFAPEVDGGIYY